MKKIASIVGIAVVTALAGYLVGWLKDPDNFELAQKEVKKYKGKLSKFTKKAKRRLKSKMEEYQL